MAAVFKIIAFSVVGIVGFAAFSHLPREALSSPGTLASALQRAASLSAALPASKPAGLRPQVRVAQATLDDVPVILSAIGAVQAYNTVAIKSRVDGELTEIRFREGQDVKAGDVVAVVDTRPLQAQVAQQRATLAKDQALLNGARLDLTRYEILGQKNYVSQQQIDQQRSLSDQYKAQVQTDEALLDLAKTQLGYASIVTPISGRTGIRQIDQGNMIQASAGPTIVTISQVQPISVIFTLSARAVAASRLSLGEVKIPVDIYGADDIELIESGTVETIDNQVDQNTGTIKLKASFPNADLRLWPGGFVNGRIVVDTRRSAVTIPVAALRHGPRGDYVYVVKENTVEIRYVRAGPEDGSRISIENGLRGNDIVVVEGHYRLENGVPVDVVDETRPPAERPRHKNEALGSQGRRS